MSGADFRFHLPFGGLDLCSLDATTGVPADASGMVPMTLRFADDGGQEWLLLYDCIFHSTAPITTGSASQATVTRMAGAAGGWSITDWWTIEGTDACLISSGNYATATDATQIGNLDADFHMTIRPQ